MPRYADRLDKRAEVIACAQAWQRLRRMALEPSVYADRAAGVVFREGPQP